MNQKKLKQYSVNLPQDVQPAGEGAMAPARSAWHVLRDTACSLLDEEDDQKYRRNPCEWFVDILCHWKSHLKAKHDVGSPVAYARMPHRIAVSNLGEASGWWRLGDLAWRA